MFAGHFTGDRRSDDPHIPFLAIAQRLFVSAAPLSGVHLADLVMEATDAAMVGRLGAMEIAAVGLGAGLMSMYFVFCFSVAGQVGAFISKRLGQDDVAGVVVAVRSGLVLNGSLALPAIVIAWSIEPVLVATGQDPEVARMTGEYLRIAAFALLPWVLFSVFDFFAAALGSPRYAFAISWFGAGLNVLGNYGLVYGKFGLPALGIEGSAISTVATASFNLALITLVIALHPRFRRFKIFRARLDGATSPIAQMLRLGSPPGLASASELGFLAALSILIGSTDANLLAACQIAITVSLLIYAVVTGLGVGLTCLVAEFDGRGSREGVRFTCIAAQAIGLAFLIGFAALCFLCPNCVVSIFLDMDDVENSATIALASRVLGLFALCRVFHGVRMLSARALAGLGDTLVPSAITFAGSWAFSLPLGLALVHSFGFDGMGYIWAEIAAAGFAAILVTARLSRVIAQGSPLPISSRRLAT
jgi:MATE family multidrug resistance protein